MNITNTFTYILTGRVHGKWCCSRNTRYCVSHATRFIGFLPYSWKRNRTQGEMKGPETLVFSKSTTWLLWSTFIMIGRFVMMLLDLYWTFKEPRGLLLGYRTLVITQIMFDFVTTTTVIILNFLSWFRGDSLAFLIYNFSQKLEQDKLQPDSNVSKAKRTRDAILHFISIPLVFFVNIYVGSFYFHNIWSLLFGSVKIVNLVFFINLIRILHVTTLEFVKNELRALFQPLQLMYESCDGVHVEQCILSKWKLELLPQCQEHKDATIEEKNDEVSANLSEFEATSTETEIENLSLDKINANVQKLFRHLRASNLYLDLSIAVSMLCLVF